MNLSEEKFQPNRPSKMFLMDLAAQKNSQPLLPIRQNYGLRLPNDRFCQVQPNFVFDDKAISQIKEELTQSKSALQTYNSNLSGMNVESVMMNLDSSQQQIKRRRLQDDEQQNEENNDAMRDDYYD